MAKDNTISKIKEDIEQDITDTIKEPIPKRKFSTSKIVDRQAKDTIRVLKAEVKKNSPYEVKHDTASFAKGNGTVTDEYIHIKNIGGNKDEKTD